MVSGHYSIHYDSYFLCQYTGQFLPTLVEFGYALGFEILMAAITIQNRKFLYDRPAALPYHFGSAGQFAAVNGD
jgi:hypothetical protein